ncbi:GH3 auxin-responsive promoter family protein [Tenacibaculum finnmarkense genomovar finnmarkense]|uniref:GH3 auxin-responsive promoter family protein n=1 Tax=Tenacibaculum finnmarkense TaxID=2781243 RepID=UPI001E4B2079|nr:GH3 auxin-responsive promoter family protein [Tenacibaculum finnmarkense]MCD8416270.1 GH3 auxin-responsive promoter family protein [Tenacibaculum finnmarkense genomovar finnmarkense]MCG8184930.1 GH3 auxin-responsive promoter family protein [Tenacibaculum finnmarkense genomovar finnmarkense]MCG8201236.1 GH3 auxin-responsive promoter family protein [Tenacibaculum finnmarkense genomovar finnmarkense]MCG8208889.1 GH3 auxin-responsive promoter family protein [Tenacibaculum finnmarkense genomovar 
MSFPFINSIISWFLKKRKHQVELFLKYPIDVQNELLLKLINTAKNTEFGASHNFLSIENYTDFSKNVPIQKYESIEPLIERCRKGEQNLFWPTPIRWFAKSSGTTNAKSKFIPVSNQAIEDCHLKAGKDMLCLYVSNNENSKMFKGKGLKLGGSTAIYENNNSSFGDLSAILTKNLPFWADFSSAPSHEVSLMAEWETKMEAIINETIDENITSLVGVPSWMLVLLNRVLEKTGKDNILEVWPNLEVYFHGGVNFSPYREQYQKLIPKKEFKYYETYNASEGFFAIQDVNNSDELLLMLDYGIFYEFIPMTQYDDENSTAIPLSEVKTGVNYAIIITTNSGLWRYLIGDTVRFTNTNPYRIKITGRTKHHINVFGEELIIENAEDALKIACKKTKASIKEYTVGPIFMVDKKSGGHQWIIEFDNLPENMEYFTELLDDNLKKINSDYEAKRYNNMTLAMPIIHIARTNLFYDWFTKKGKLGGQHKVPRLSNSRNFVEELLEL